MIPSMIWQRKTLDQISEQLKDAERNGNRDRRALIKHARLGSIEVSILLVTV